jgi:hypothetical protein
MEKITLKGKYIVQVGDSLGFTVDRAYFKNGQMDEKKQYTVTIEEV